FLTRDAETYAPILSSAVVRGPRRSLRIGKYTVPIGRPRVKLLRKGIPFWKRLGDRGVFSTIIRVPITFPPEKFHGCCLSGMCVPDLRGTQGSFTHFTSEPPVDGAGPGGTVVRVEVKGGEIRTALPGPVNPLSEKGGDLGAPMRIRILSGGKEAEIRLGGKKIRLGLRVFSDWIRVPFRAGLGIRVRGIVRLYINSLSPRFDLYVSPIQIDPERPALPISHPLLYSVYLAKLIGTYGTLGLAEDTWALNQGVIDEKAFLEQAYLYHEEREAMLFDALEKNRSGVCVCVFDTTDRIQHMFYRTLEPDHPANAGREVTAYKGVLGDLYARMDGLLGRVQERLGPETLLMVISDHGFTSFRRGVNLNAWLQENGYLSLREGSKESGEWLAGIDWESTRAYSLGLAGIFLNRKGREKSGVVEGREEIARLKKEISSRLKELVDPKTGKAVCKEVYDSEAGTPGPFTRDAPDLLVGFQEGYRVSWEGATGKISDEVISDNVKAWSGDHCVDPSLVPGVFFCSEPVETDEISILDIAPTVLDLFGAPIPEQFQGKKIPLRLMKEG
ncbi:MAG: alkaline phosphatase family protein, partial [Planctomycetota bacterium]|nr:alkaline phosphatase family protein [Planctomycetota bacterium]